MEYVVQGGDAGDFWIAAGALVGFALLAVGLATAVVRPLLGSATDDVPDAGVAVPEVLAFVLVLVAQGGSSATNSTRKSPPARSSGGSMCARFSVRWDVHLSDTPVAAVICGCGAVSYCRT
jgi:hypothetical protein